MYVEGLIKYVELSEQQKDQVKQLYSLSFPANERRPFNELIENVNARCYEMYVYARLDNINAIAFVYYSSYEKLALLDYFAVHVGMRRSGIGSICFRFLIEILKKKNISLIMEVEDPNYGENRYEKERRIDFYELNGSRLIKNYNYILPDLSGMQETTRMKLMLASSDIKLAGEELKIFIKDIFINLYHRKLNDPILTLNLDSVPDALTIKT